MNLITYNQFKTVDIRSGRIVKAEPFPRAINPSLKIWADFGEDFGVLKTSAQITRHYKPENLKGKAILGVINLGSKNIAGFISEFLLLGLPDENGDIVLVSPDLDVPNGAKLR